MTFTEYITAYLGNIATSFDLEDDFYTFLLSETLKLYGVETESDCTDLSKLHKLGVMVLWERLMVKSSASFDFSANGGNFHTSQLYEFCQKNYTKAYFDCYPYLASGTIEVVSFPVSGSTTQYWG